jgi:hypothetical protein
MNNSENKLFNARVLENWDKNYQKLVSLKANPASGNLPLPAETEKEIKKWARIQRRMKHMLPAPLKSKLAAIDFDFEEQEPEWENFLKQLENFYQTHGHCFLPEADPAMAPLRDWLIRQIHDQQYLSADQHQQLEALGIDWNMIPRKAFRWQQMYLKLKGFHALFGHSQVPHQWVHDRQLATWVSVQRRTFSKQRIPAAREHLLRELDFVWHIRSQLHLQWTNYYQQLTAFFQQQGHCQVPGSQEKLVSWIERQRLAKKNNLISPEREKQLNDIHFIWTFQDIKESYWQEKYQELLAYHQSHGHCLVPVSFKQNPSLGHWVATQRKLEAHNKLSREKRQPLEHLGFVWAQEILPQRKHHYDLQWQVQFENLRSYQHLYGTCQVSLKIDPELQRWTRWQRRHYNEGKLLDRRREQLTSINFPWSIQEGYWLKMYAALADFRRQHGHTRVRFSQGADNKLAAWEYSMRKNKAQLTNRQVALLNEIGFDWYIPVKTVVSWQDMYQRLLAFRQAYGHTRVPVKWPRDPKLGKWVSRMRHQQATLPPERLALLEAIAFDWGRRLALEMA